MKVKVLKIVPSSTREQSKFNRSREIPTFDVEVLIDLTNYWFRLAVDIDRIGDQEVQVIQADREFHQVFRLNLTLHQQITQLVSQVYNDQLVKLPKELDDFSNPQAVSLVSSVN